MPSEEGGRSAAARVTGHRANHPHANLVIERTKGGAPPAVRQWGARLVRPYDSLETRDHCDEGPALRPQGVIRAQRDQGVTVLLTTHFMDEAEQLADRVAIMHHGRLVALDTPAGMRREVGKELRVGLARAVAPSEVAAALSLDERDVSSEGEQLLIRVEPTPALIAALAAWLSRQGVLLTELRAGSRSLEQAFLDITDSSRESVS